MARETTSVGQFTFDACERRAMTRKDRSRVTGLNETLRYFLGLGLPQRRPASLSPYHPLAFQTRFTTCSEVSGANKENLRAVQPDHGFPARDKSHPITFWYGLRRN
jgi:hypothetical protein